MTPDILREGSHLCFAVAAIFTRLQALDLQASAEVSTVRVAALDPAIVDLGELHETFISQIAIGFVPSSSYIEDQRNPQRGLRSGFCGLNVGCLTGEQESRDAHRSNKQDPQFHYLPPLVMLITPRGKSRLCS